MRIQSQESLPFASPLVTSNVVTLFSDLDEDFVHSIENQKIIFYAQDMSNTAIVSPSINKSVPDQFLASSLRSETWG